MIAFTPPVAGTPCFVEIDRDVRTAVTITSTSTGWAWQVLGGEGAVSTWGRWGKVDPWRVIREGSEDTYRKAQKRAFTVRAGRRDRLKAKP